VSVLLFNLYKLIRGSAAVRVFIGFLFLYFFYLIVRALGMELLTSILGQFMGVGVIAAIILFQQEIKRFLVLLGNRTTELQDFQWFTSLFSFSKPNPVDSSYIIPLVEAVKAMSVTQTGALIVLCRRDELRALADTGDSLDAKISKRMIESIFYKNSPLHDGACIIYKKRITAARCILPVSENPDIPAHLGLRHRAGMGVTETSDALALIVSEQTGQISCIQHGQIQANISLFDLSRRLHHYLIGQDLQLR
jgi:diadenylate cyclase